MPETAPPAGQAVAPCVPRSAEHAVRRPVGIDRVRLTEGFWAGRQRVNREVTVPHVLRWLGRDGAIDNLRRLAAGPGAAAPPRRGMLFSDSDLYKALEGVAWELGRQPSADLAAFGSDAASVIASAQQDDGYVNSYVQAGLRERWVDLTNGHELYCLGHLLQAAVAHARATGGGELLTIACRAADLLVKTFGDGRRGDTDGHPEIETALVELYRHTGDGRYLDLAGQLVDVRGHGVLGNGHFGSAYYQDDVPVRARHTVVGHAVRALYLLAGMVDCYLETGEAALLDAAQRQWASMVAGKTYLTGAVGSRFEGEAFGDAYELPPDLVYGETCAGIASVMASYRLLLATGHGRYADLIERTLHNLVAASTSVSGDGFFYVNPMQRRARRAAAPPDGKPQRADAPGTRPAWFDCACCPPNIMRLLASLGSYLATTDDTGVQLHLYAGAELSIPVGPSTVQLRVQTGYPHDGEVTVTVEQTPDAPWSLALRIPGWCRAATVDIDGRTRDAPADAYGYHVLRRAWRAGCVVRLHLPMPPRLTVAHPAVDAVRGCVAIERGPLVYCLESPDQPDLDLDRVQLRAGAPVREQWRDDLPGGGATALVADGAVRDDSTWHGAGWATLGEAPRSAVRAATLTAVPYHLWANRGPSTMRVWVPLDGG